MTFTPFEHPALTSAATRLSALRTAASHIGAPDPVAALRHLDCAPSAVRTSARAVAGGASALKSARTEFHAGVDRAAGAGSTQTFGTRADTVDTHYAEAAAAATATADLGTRIATHLDALATATAAEVSALAQAAEQSTRAVLRGDRSPEAVETVSTTCATVLRTVQEKLSVLPGLAAELQPLTTPVVTRC